MVVYEVISTNLDVNDGYFCNVLFADIEAAKELCKQHIIDKNAKNVVEDLEGKLDEYQGRSLNYSGVKGCPAIYYNSYWGNYKCVVFVETRKVH